jgi:hypothetical protein
MIATTRRFFRSLCLLVCLVSGVVVGVWGLRSYQLAHRITWLTDHRAIELTSNSDVLTLAIGYYSPNPGWVQRGDARRFETLSTNTPIKWGLRECDVATSHVLGGFGFGTKGEVADFFAVPHWFLSLLLLLWPLLRLGRFVSYNLRTRWRSRNGGCVTCGYDLTGSTSGKCPECGKPAL